MSLRTDSRIAALPVICEQFAVCRLDVFGSATGHAERPFDPGRSDIHFLVQFDEPRGMGPADQFFGLLEALEALFDRPVDLVDEQAIRNPYFRRGVEATREAIYVAPSEEVSI